MKKLTTRDVLEAMIQFFKKHNFTPAKDITYDDMMKAFQNIESFIEDAKDANVKIKK